MPSPFARVLKGSAQTAHNLVTQVVVSVTAAICVAFITNAYFDKEAPAAPQPYPAAVEASLPDGQRPDEIRPAAKAVVAVTSPAPASPTEAASAPAPLPKLEPVIIADAPTLAPAVTAHGTEIFFPPTVSAPVIQFAPAPIQEPRARVLGVPLPRFLPTPSGVARTVGGIKDRMVSLLPGRERPGELNNSAR